MEKPSQPQVLILAEAPKPSMLERAIGIGGVVGGALVGTHFGLRMYGGAGSHPDIDVTKPGSWEVPLEEAAVSAPSAAAQAQAESVVSEELARASGKKMPKTGTVARAEMDTNAELEQLLRRQNPNAKLEPVATGSKHTTDVKPLGITDTPYKEHVPQTSPSGKAAPRVVSAKQAKQLIALATSESGGIEAITYHRKGNILSAKLHLTNGPSIHIPEIDPIRVGLGSHFMGKGARHVTSAEGVAIAAMQIIPNALSRREMALVEDKGVFKATWGALKKLDGSAKFNIAGVTLMGVILGGVVADVAKSIVRGVSHMGTAAPARGETIKPR